MKVENKNKTKPKPKQTKTPNNNNNYVENKRFKNELTVWPWVIILTEEWDERGVEERLKLEPKLQEKRKKKLN